MMLECARSEVWQESFSHDLLLWKLLSESEIRAA